MVLLTDVLCLAVCSFGWWLVADGWCWLIADGWSVLREKYCWLVADKPSEQGVGPSM
jgi:hypothetical protein